MQRGSASNTRHDAVTTVRTRVLAQNQTVDRVETEQTQEVPRDTRDVADVHVRGLDASLEHRLEADGQRERKASCDGEGVSSTVARRA